MKDDAVGKIVFCHEQPLIDGTFEQLYVDDLLDYVDSYDVPTSVVKYKEDVAYMNHSKRDKC